MTEETLLAKHADLLRILAIAIHKLGGSIEINAGDYLAVEDKVFFSTRQANGIGEITLQDGKPGTPF